MRWKLFTDEQAAGRFAKVVEDLIAATKPAIPVIKRAVWLDHLQRWCVAMEIEPEGVSGDIVETVEQPIITDSELP